MKVLGLDNATRTGYGIVEDGVFKDAYHIKLTGDTVEAKLVNYEHQVRHLILTTKPDRIMVEKPNDTTGLSKVYLAFGIYGVIHVLAAQYGIPVEGVNAMTLKKAITGTGRAEKITVCDTLVNHYGVPRDKIEIPEYYKTKTYMDGRPRVKDYHYDESDGTALAFYYFIKPKEIETGDVK